MNVFQVIQKWFQGSTTPRRNIEQRTRRRGVRVETLEGRELFAGDLRSFDGTGNNLANPEWGSTAEVFLRKAAAEYADGRSAPAGADRASARAISNLVAAHPAEDTSDERGLSAFIYAWGQFLDHDIDLTNSATPTEAFNIAVPKGDQYFDPLGTGTKTIGLTRSIYDPATGVTNARQQMNSITAFVDGSMVYGSDKATADSLRTFVGGKMKTSADNLLPTDAAGFFSAGDIRVNENPNLVAMQTLFVREHNRVAGRMAVDNPAWNDERLYQEARRVVIGEIQAITYNEFIPALLGNQALQPYRGYNPQVNPGISNEFATAAFRLGHSMLDGEIEFLDNQGNELRDPVSLRDSFFNTQIVKDTGIDPILKYLASDVSERIDTRVIDDVRNFLFGAPGSGGLDLAALNIQRGRDHGLADYNDTRAAYGLPKVRSFAEITKDPATQQALAQAYGSVDKIDLWVGGLAEDHVPGAAVGPLFQRILADQFQRLRDGDRFWYERDLTGPSLDAVRRTTLADVIRRNTVTTNLQDNVFFFRTSIEGRVFLDGNANGRVDLREQGAAGVAVTLEDADGNVVATTTTRNDGSYRFEGLDLGRYKVRVRAPVGQRLTTRDAVDVRLTKGERIERIDFGLAPAVTAAATAPANATRQRR